MMTVGSLAEETPRDERAHRARHLGARRFQIVVLLATLAFGALAVLARTVLYFEADLALTRAIQQVQQPAVLALFEGVSWIGYPPQSNYVFGSMVIALFVIGRRLESAGLLFAAVGSAALWFWLAPLVDRPRPSPELVNVGMQISAGSFPSGHALNLTAIFGFLVYLAFTQLRAARPRVLAMVALLVPILVVGVARVHAGAHWPSDVLGGYLLGGIWLALTIELYRWAKQRLSKHHRAN